MKNLQKFLTDLVGGSEGYAALSKAVPSEERQHLVAPRLLVSWLAKHISELKQGEQRTVSMPGTSDKFVTLRKNAKGVEADVVSHGKLVLSVPVLQQGNDLTFLKYVLEQNGVTPGEPTKKSVSAIGKLADTLVKTSEKKQTEMEEDHKVHDSTKPEEKYEQEIKDAAKDKTLEKPVPSIAEFERAQSQVRTQPFQKDGMKEDIASGLNSKTVADAASKLQTMRPHAPKGVPGSQKMHLRSALEKLGRMKAMDRAREATAPAPQKLIGSKSAMKKEEMLSKPPVSEAQRKAMHAAAAGHSTLGIPKKVGKEFSDADKPGKLPARIKKAGEMPSGAGIPKQPKQAKPPVMPSVKPANAAEKQAQMSGKGKQLVQAKPKMAMKSEPTATNLKKFSVTEAEANTPCEHCKKSQFKNGKFDPCLCFQVEKHSKDPFVKLVKSASGTKLEFRKDADPESMHAFLLALKLGLIAEKLNRR